MRTTPGPFGARARYHRRAAMFLLAMAGFATFGIATEATADVTPPLASASAYLGGSTP